MNVTNTFFKRHTFWWLFMAFLCLLLPAVLFLIERESQPNPGLDLTPVESMKGSTPETFDAYQKNLKAAYLKGTQRKTANDFLFQSSKEDQKTNRASYNDGKYISFDSKTFSQAEVNRICSSISEKEDFRAALFKQFAFLTPSDAARQRENIDYLLENPEKLQKILGDNKSLEENLKHIEERMMEDRPYQSVSFSFNHVLRLVPYCSKNQFVQQSLQTISQSQSLLPGSLGDFLGNNNFASILTPISNVLSIGAAVLGAYFDVIQTLNAIQVPNGEDTTSYNKETAKNGLFFGFSLFFLALLALSLKKIKDQSLVSSIGCIFSCIGLFFSYYFFHKNKGWQEEGLKSYHGMCGNVYSKIGLPDFLSFFKEKEIYFLQLLILVNSFTNLIKELFYKIPLAYEQVNIYLNTEKIFIAMKAAQENSPQLVMPHVNALAKDKTWLGKCFRKQRPNLHEYNLVYRFLYSFLMFISPLEHSIDINRIISNKDKNAVTFRNALFDYRNLIEIAQTIKQGECTTGGQPPITIPVSIEGKRPYFEVEGSSLFQSDKNEQEEKKEIFYDFSVGQHQISLLVGDNANTQAYLQTLVQNVYYTSVKGVVRGKKGKCNLPDKICYVGNGERDSFKRFIDMLNYAELHPDKKILILVNNDFFNSRENPNVCLMACMEAISKLPNIAAVLGINNTNIYDCLKKNNLDHQLDIRFLITSLGDNELTGKVVNGKMEQGVIAATARRNHNLPLSMQKSIQKIMKSSPNFSGDKYSMGLSAGPSSSYIIGLILLLFLCLWGLLCWYVKRKSDLS